MDETFLNVARQTGCKSVTGAAVKSIRKHAVNKNENPRRASGSMPNGDDLSQGNDKNLLPTPTTLKTALSHKEVLLELVQCRCQALCGPQWRRLGPAQDETTAQMILQVISKEDKLNALAVLVLSGCTFAIRDFLRSDCNNLDEFLAELSPGPESSVSDAGSREEDESGVRAALFQRLVITPDWAGETITSMASKFADCVKDKLWLVRIRSFSVDGQLVSIKRRSNLPFVEERPAFQGRMNRRYLRFKISSGYTLSKELQDRTLFRKELSFPRPPLDGGWLDEAHNEVEMLDIINGLNHRNIARMLFAFEEFDSLKQHVSVVFRYHEFDLGRVLHSSSRESIEILSRFENAIPLPVPFEGILEHGLWKAMLGIVDAIKALHEFEHPGIQASEREVIHAGHFDIKPGNILVDIRHQNHAKLLLTDFGRAHLHRHPVDQTSGHQGNPATYDYAPPESEPFGIDSPALTPASEMGDETGEFRLRRNYDTWSLGCVLLEVVNHLSTGEGERFHHDRERDSAEDDQNAAFWCRDRKQNPKLRSAVESRLKFLERSRQANLERTMRCLRNMLSVDELERRRWPVKKCLAEFETVEVPSWNEMMPVGKRALLDPDLANMTTLCWKKTFQQPLICNLFYYRDQSPSESDEATLIVERPGVPWNESRLIEQEIFAPITFFNNKTISTNAQSTTETLRCAFDRLHNGMVFHFQRVDQYLDFFSLMTYQRVALGRDRSGLDMRYQTCQLHVNRAFRSKVEQFGPGRVMLWSTYDEKDYKRKFGSQTVNSGAEFRKKALSVSTSQSEFSSLKGDSVMSPSGEERGLPDAMNSRFKLALFMFRSGATSGDGEPKQVCVVVELDSENIEADPKASSSNKLVFARANNHSSFPVAIFEPSVVAPWKNSLDDIYPGIPMSPSKLNETIRESKVRLKRLEIHFPPGSADLAKLWTLLQHYGL